MHLFVKTFNRPFYLDRCLRSIKSCQRGLTRITVLDDGTQHIFLKKLQLIHPEVEFVSSGADDKKYELVKEGRFSEIQRLYPDCTQFWPEQILKSKNSHVVVVEDDTWFIRSLDFAKINQICSSHKVMTAKLWWGNTPKSAFNSQSCPQSVGPQIVIQEISPVINNLEDVWEIWLECMMVYDKELYAASYYELQAGLSNETARLQKCLNFIVEKIESNSPTSFMRTNQRCMAQGWACPGRSDSKYYEIGIQPHEFLDVLNYAWLEGRFDSSENFPFDFSNDYLNRFFSEKISKVLLERYWSWRKGNYGQGYEFFLDRLF